jgi:trehalose synthase
VTKQLHNQLHDLEAGAQLGPAERAIYEETLAARAAQVLARVRPGDVVVLNDPQPLGLSRALAAAGAVCVWRCHIGTDAPGQPARDAREFLRPYLDSVEASVFSREAHAWDGLDRNRVRIIPPSIDAFSSKNRLLDAGAVARILAAAGLRLDGASPGPARFERSDGSPAEVAHRVSFADGGPPPPPTRRSSPRCHAGTG